MENVQIIRLHGSQLLPYLEQLGQLRIKVFYDFPYLYKGSVQYEKEYLQVYVNNAKSLTVGLVHGHRWVGATTAVPLNAETEAVKTPFIKAGIDVKSVCYFGESVLLPEYRGKGYGHLFFDERERSLEKGYSVTAFCAVLRSEEHPLRPMDYRNNEVFWTKRGYAKQSDLRCQMSWLDRGEIEPTTKELEFWIREWK